MSFVVDNENSDPERLRLTFIATDYYQNSDRDSLLLEHFHRLCRLFVFPGHWKQDHSSSEIFSCFVALEAILRFVFVFVLMKLLSAMEFTDFFFHIYFRCYLHFICFSEYVKVTHRILCQISKSSITNALLSSLNSLPN